MQALEAYIYEMESRNSASNSMDTSSIPEDVWTQLQQKENDLQLAAELGNALLEKNKELQKQYDAMAEEYQKKLEVSTSFFLLIGSCGFFYCPF